MQTKTNPESISECLSEYQKELLKERTALRQQLRDAGNLLDATPIQESLTEIETELANLNNDNSIEFVV